MEVKLPYGESSIRVEVPDSAEVLLTEEIPALGDEDGCAAESLADPIGSPPLADLARPGDKVAIVISDITRPTPNHKIVPWVLEALKETPRERITVINGTGSHRPNTDEELVGMLGEDIVRSVRVINHDAFDPSALSCAGRLRSGEEAYLNREYCRSDLRIVTGFIEPHFFAGFSGGVKGIMPGVAGIDTIMRFHSAGLIGHPKSSFGILEDNPVQQMAREVAAMCRPQFAVNVTLNDGGEITGIFAGDAASAHRKGSEVVRKQSMIPCQAPYDIVVTTNSGYPLDLNLYQAVKGMTAAQQVVKKGGDIICASECREGLPGRGNFAKILKMRESPEEILAMINESGFSMYDQWEAQKLAMIQLEAEVHLYSGLSREAVTAAHLTPVDTIESCLGKLLEKHGRQARIAVLPQGPQTIPYLRG